MTRLLAKLRSLRDERLGSVPSQYSIVAAVTAMATMMIVETVGKKVSEKLNAVTTAFNKIQF